MISHSEQSNDLSSYCTLHKTMMKMRHTRNGGRYYDHRLKGLLIRGRIIWDEVGSWYWCQGKGWRLSANQN